MLTPRLRAITLTALLGVLVVLLPATPANAAVVYAGTLAGPSVAATYPSGLEYDDVNGRLVVADTGLDRVEFYTYDVGAGTWQKQPGQFGTHGTGNGQFDSPRDVAIDEAGNIYVADAANNRVQSFTSTGAFRWLKGGTGACNDCLNTPIGVTWDAANDVLLVASTGQDLIKAFNANGVYQWRSPTAATIGIDAPRDAARGPDGRLWIADYAHHQVKAFNVSANGLTWTNTPAITLGDGATGGSGTNQVNFPYNMDFSQDGQTVYVSDTGNNRIARWSLSGTTATWLPPIAGDCPAAPNPCPDPPADLGTIDTLRRVVVDPAGQLVTADFWGNGMQVWNASSGAALLQIELVAAPAPGFAQAFGVATGPTGLVYAVDRLNQRLEHFNGTATFVRSGGSRGTAAGKFSWPEAVAVDASSGLVWAADTRGDRIQRWPAALTGSSTFSRGSTGSGVGQFNYIEDLDVAPDGAVYIADTRNNRIQVYTPGTDLFSVFTVSPTSPTTLARPQGVVATATSVYVADTNNNRILKFARSTGAQQAVFSTGLAGPQGVAVDDSDGTVWVADTGNNRILHLSADLVNLGDTFGSAGTGNLQFNLPHTLDVTGDRLYVTDTFNDRITYFDISSLGGGPDTTPPTTTVAAPTTGQVYTALPAAMSGTATDNVGVQKVEVAIQDRVSKLWYRSNATWGSYQKQLTTLASPGAASTGWSFSWAPPAGGSNQYGVSVIATDTANLVATVKPWVTFDVNTSGGGGGLTATYAFQVSAAGGIAPLYPAGGATGADGTRYVADSGGSRIVAISSGGVQSELSPPSAGWDDPRDLDVDVEVPTELWVADTADHQIVRLGTNGQVLATFGGTGVLNQPYGLSNDASGVYVADTYNNRVVKLNESTGAVIWTSTTCAGNTFQRPRDVAVGSNGEIFVADTDRNRIVRLSAAGACLGAFGASGTGNGQYRAPRSITSDGAGGLWITEGTGARLQHVTNSGAYLGKIGAFGEGDGQFRSAHCVFLDAGFVDVCDTYNYRIQRFSVNGAGVPAFSSSLGGVRPANGGFNGPWDVAYGPDGSMYVSDWFNHRIQKFDAAGNFVASWGGYGTANGSYIFPRGIEVRSDGTVVVTDSENNRIDLLTSSGSFVQSIKPSGTQTKFLRPHQTAVSPNGTYWVADTGNNRIVRIDAAGTVVQNWNNGNTIKAPRGIAVDENGDVYVANSGNNRIEKYSVTGTRLAILATNGTGPGQVKNPYGLRIVGTGANALLLVADRGNNRIQVFRLDGTPVTRFGTVGTGNGQLQQPQGVARNPLTGEIAVADFTNNRLSVWSTT